MKKQTDHYQNEFATAWPELPGYKTSWIDQVRLKAINRFAQDGFPHPRAEDWKYTDLSAVKEQPFGFVRPLDGKVSPERIRSVLGEIDASAILVFLNGHYLQTLFRQPEWTGVVVISLAEAITQQPRQLKELLADSSPSLTAFETLNTAFMNDGVYLQVDPGMRLEKPVVVLHLTDDQSSEQSIMTRNLLVFGEAARVTVLEKYDHIGNGSGYLTNVVNQAVLNNGAEVDYYKLQDEASSAFHFSVNHIKLQENSRFHANTFSFGGRLSRENLKLELEGANASCRLNGLFMVDGDRQADVYTEVEHKVAGCRSEETVRGIVDQQAKGVFRGKIKVYQDAQKTDAKLNNANLVLSDEAEVNTMPQLEIYADDVKCSHGSGSGQLDEEQLFYLTSRGVDESIARNLLVFAFANTIIDRIESSQIQSVIRNQMLSKFKDSAMITGLLQ